MGLVHHFRPEQHSIDTTMSDFVLLNRPGTSVEVILSPARGYKGLLPEEHLQGLSSQRLIIYQGHWKQKPLTHHRNAP